MSKKLTMPIDYSDHSCIFAINKSGQRTNGGCRCLPSNMKTEIKLMITRLLKVRNTLTKLPGTGKPGTPETELDDFVALLIYEALNPTEGGKDD